SNLGILFVQMGDYASARPVLERALTIREQVLPPDHLDAAGSLADLALLLLRTATTPGPRRATSARCRSRCDASVPIIRRSPRRSSTWPPATAMAATSRPP